MLSPSKQCKAAGLASFAEAVRISAVPYQTLMDWHEDKPKQFECMIAGAAAIKHNGSGWSSERAIEAGKRKNTEANKKWLLLESLSDTDKEIVSALIKKLWASQPDLYKQGK